MIVSENQAKNPGMNFSILGTDISKESLKRADEGTYSQFEVQRGLPTPLLIKYFLQNESFWSVSSKLRSIVKYRHLNLLEDFRGLGKFDVVFCRNVLIYFDLETKVDILRRIRAQMPDDGILVLGGAETVINVTDQFKMIPGKQGFYAINLDAT